MPNHHPSELNDLYQEELAHLREKNALMLNELVVLQRDAAKDRQKYDVELMQAQDKNNMMLVELVTLQRDATKIVQALDASTQLIEALLAWLPDGMALSQGVKTAHGAWKHAMETIYRR